MSSPISLPPKPGSQSFFNISSTNISDACSRSHNDANFPRQFEAVLFPIKASVGAPVFGAIFSTFIVSAMLFSFLNNANKDKVKNQGSVLRSYTKDSVNYGAVSDLFEGFLKKSFGGLIIEPGKDAIGDILEPFYRKHGTQIADALNYFSKMTPDQKAAFSQQIEELSQSPFIENLLSPAPNSSLSQASAIAPAASRSPDIGQFGAA